MFYNLLIKFVIHIYSNFTFKEKNLMANLTDSKKINWENYAWVVGIIFLLVGLSSLSVSIVGGIFYVLVAVFIIPKTVLLISTQPKISFLAKRLVRYPIIFLFFVIAFNIVTSAKNQILLDDFMTNKTEIIQKINENIKAGEFSTANATIKKYRDITGMYNNEELKNLLALSETKQAEAKKAEENKAAAEAKAEEAREARAARERSASASSDSAQPSSSASGNTVIQTIGTRVDLRDGSMFGIDEQTVLDINGQYIQRPNIYHIKVGDICTYQQGVRLSADQVSCRR